MHRSVLALLQLQSRCLCCSSNVMSRSYLTLPSCCCSRSRSSVVSFALTFNASLNSRAPFHRSCYLFCSLQLASCLCLSLPCCCCCTHLRSSVVSVVLTFNASLSACAPSNRIWSSSLFVKVDVALLFDIVLLLFTAHVQRFQCSIELQCFAQFTCFFLLDPARCFCVVDVMPMKRFVLLMDIPGPVF